MHELLRRAYELEPKEKSALFAIIDEIVTEDMVPDLIARMGGKDPAVKIHLIHLLSKFKRREISHAFEMQLTDTNKMVRSAALVALGNRGNAVNIEKVARLLRDPDLDVQNKAVDVIVKVKHPDTVKYLVEALKDESEYTRRSAVEVLNEICDPGSVKDLLAAIKDDDWWVRARAGDALAEIGGPKVINSVLELIKDKDEDIRRTAIEILNATKDESAVDTLIKATDDPDWWVRERAVDALAQIGSKKAIPKLLAMLGSNAKTDTIVVRALGKTRRCQTSSPRSCRCCKGPNVTCRSKSSAPFPTWPTRSTPKRSGVFWRKIKQSDDKTIINSADKAIKEIDAKFSATVLAENVRAEKMAEPTKTLLLDDQDLARLLEAQAKASAGRQAKEEGRRADCCSCTGNGTEGPRYFKAESWRCDRRPVQVHRENRQGCIRHRAADAGPDCRRTADSQVPESERIVRRRNDEALRP